MNRKQELEKRFSDYLDRILAGEEITLDADTDAELLAAIEFARRIRSLGQSPSESFRTYLKASLLQKLEQQESQEAARVGFWSKLWRQPVWQGAIMVAFAVIIVGLLWRAGIIIPEDPEETITPTTTTATATTTAQPTTTQPTTTAQPTTTDPTTIPTDIPRDIYLSVDANTDKSVYQSGEQVIIELSLTNDGEDTITMVKLPPIVSLMDVDTQQPVYTFSSGQQVFTIVPDQIINFALVWNQEDFEGQPVSGRFYVEIEDLIYLDQTIQLHLEEPVEFDIVSDL